MKKIISIERKIPTSKLGASCWKAIFNGAKVELWEKMMGTVDGADGQSAPIRHIFHIPHVLGIERGDRVNYLGVAFKILHISDSRQLMGLELICEIAEGDAR